MTLFWGAVLAAGILLTASPWMWPARANREASRGSRQLTRMLEEAGLDRVRPLSIVALSLLLGAIAAATAWLSTQVFALTAVGAAVGIAAPFWWLRARRLSLLRTRRALWSDVCSLLIASVRAGMSLSDSVSSLAHSAPLALRPAFTAFASDIAASGHFDSSAIALKERLADPVADRIIETLRMARQVGGTELTSVLRALAESVRADAALRAEVEAKQSWVRGAASLGVAAPWVILVLLASRPEARGAYASAEGVVLIVAGAAVSVVAYRVMLAIGRLPEPRRWFG